VPDVEEDSVRHSPASIAGQARSAVKRLRQPAGEFDASRYFRGPVNLGFYNIGASAVRALARSIHTAHKADWTVDDALAFADILIRDRFFEVKSVGVEVVARYRREFTPRLLPIWKRWLSDGHASNWATTDSISGFLIGRLLLEHPELVPTLRAWATHRSMWVRRAAAVSLIPSLKRGRSIDVAYDVARTLHGDGEDLIHKAVGWLLREAGYADQARLDRYLRRMGPRIPRTTLRYAIEKMSEPRRRRLLMATRKTLPRKTRAPLDRKE
jgi:3-methyladenine DNA glycosylase AlkD